MDYNICYFSGFQTVSIMLKERNALYFTYENKCENKDIFPFIRGNIAVRKMNGMFIFTHNHDFVIIRTFNFFIAEKTQVELTTLTAVTPVFDKAACLL